MEQYFQQHLARIDRLMTIIEANNPYESSLNGLSFYDIVIFACQSMWHLKDWILNDKNFGAADIDALTREIHAEPCLLLCSDIANGSKHFLLKHPKIAGGFKQRKSFMLDSRKGVLQELYYIFYTDLEGNSHQVEIRHLLRECRDFWNKIIDKHQMTIIY